MYPLSNHAELPGTSVTAFAIQPAVQDSAVTSRHRAANNREPTACARADNAQSVTMAGKANRFADGKVRG